MSLKKLFHFKRTSVDLGIFEREDIEIVSAMDDSSVEKAIDWGLEKVKEKDATEQQFQSGFFSILIALDYSIKGKLFEILAGSGYNVVERVLCTITINGESTSANTSARKSKPKSFFQWLFSKRCKEATSKPVDDDLFSSNARPLFQLDTCLQNKTAIGSRVTSLRGMITRECGDISLQRTIALEPLVISKRSDTNVEMCLAQLLFVMFENCSYHVDAFWELVSECLGKDEKFDLLDLNDKRKFMSAMNMCGSLKPIRRILYKLLEKLSKKKSMLGKTLLEARKYAYDDNWFPDKPYVLKI